MTAEEHLAWAKARAIEYVDANKLVQALASFISDLGKHDGTSHLARPVLFRECRALFLIEGSDAERQIHIREWIEAINLEKRHD